MDEINEELKIINELFAMPDQTSVSEDELKKLKEFDYKIKNFRPIEIDELDSLDDESQEIIDGIKKDTLFSFTIDTLKPDKKQRIKGLVNSVMFSWLMDVRGENGFKFKYLAFSEIAALISKSKLFSYGVDAYKNKNYDSAKKGVEIYKKLINDRKYKLLASASGYSLSEDFGVEENYLDETIYDKIVFFKVFKKKLDLYNEEIKKDGEHKHEL